MLYSQVKIIPCPPPPAYSTPPAFLKIFLPPAWEILEKSNPLAKVEGANYGR